MTRKYNHESDRGWERRGDEGVGDDTDAKDTMDSTAFTELSTEMDSFIEKLSDKSNGVE